MDLRLLFDRVPEDITISSYSRHSLYNSLLIHAESFPDLENIDLVLIGLGDRDGKHEGPDQFRKKFYSLVRGASSYKIADLGNLRPGPNDEETRKRLSELLQSLFGKEVLPLIIGGTHDFDYAQYQAYELSEKLVSFLNVDARLDLDESDEREAGHIHRVFLHEPNYLFNYVHIGYQSYLVPQDSIDVLEHLNFSTLRLGQIRDNIEEIEPAIREADMMSFDLSALQQHYFKATSDNNVFGLTGEEACQICWYAGCNDQLSSAGFYGYEPSLDGDGSSAFVLATMVWYFIEGFYNRKDKYEFSSKYYVKYMVSLDSGDPSTIVFYKSSKSEKWWMELPLKKVMGRVAYTRNFVVPCSYEDYEIASKGEVPQKYLAACAKLV